MRIATLAGLAPASLAAACLSGCALFAAPEPAVNPAPTARAVSPAAQAAYDEAARDGRRHALRRAATEVYGAPDPAVPASAAPPALPGGDAPVVLTSDRAEGGDASN